MADIRQNLRDAKANLEAFDAHSHSTIRSTSTDDLAGAIECLIEAIQGIADALDRIRDIDI